MSGNLIILHTSTEKSSKGAASTTLIVSLLLGCTVANPLDTRRVFPDISVNGEKRAKQEPTKEFLVAFGLHDFYETRTKSFNRGNMV